MTVEVSPDADALAGAIAIRITERLARLQTAGRRPRVVLTGGSIAGAAYERMVDGGVDWAGIDFYWSDERFVPVGHPDRNDKQARDTFLTRLGVPETNIHPMPAHGCDLRISEAADTYAAELPSEPFDLVLFGMGPDGHVASLFPGYPQLSETTRHVVEVLDSPKPPAQRITMTFPALNRADSVWMLVSGAAKAEAVARALGGGGTVQDTPALGVHGTTETVWIVDSQAYPDPAP